TGEARTRSEIAYPVVDAPGRDILRPDRVPFAFLHQSDSLGGFRLPGSCPLHPLEVGPRHQTLRGRCESSSLSKRCLGPILAAYGSRNGIGSRDHRGDFPTQEAMSSRVRSKKRGVASIADACFLALYFLPFSS